MTKRNLTRRMFLGTTAAAAGALAFPRVLRGGLGQRLNLAVVGTAGQAWWNIGQIRHENIVALCDVDRNNLDRAGGEFPDAKLFRDFREMLTAGLDVDAVLVATPDHIHAPASVLAMRQGKHVYCEKPLAHSVYEVSVMRKLAAEKRLATQMGTQIHAGGNYRRVVELIRAGAIGPVREAHVWCGKSWSEGRYTFGAEPPPHLDWDLWLGPREEMPFSEGLHPANWRRFWKFGTGTLGDMACHYMDLVHWALDLTVPTAIWAEGPEVHPVGTPLWLTVHLEHPAKGERPAVKVTWYDGGKRPEILQTMKRADGSPLQWGDGQLFVGENGMLISDYNSHMLLPVEDFQGFIPPPQSIPDSIGHHNEWLKACRDGSPTTCNFAYSGALAEAVLLGNVAFRTGKKLHWNAEALAARGVPEAAGLIREPYRDGWSL